MKEFKRILSVGLGLVAGKISLTLLGLAKKLNGEGVPLVSTVSEKSEGIEGTNRAIIVTTFAERFYSDCLPLLSSLRQSGVAEPIYLVINGDAEQAHNGVLRSDFLAQVAKFPDVNPICFGSQRGVAAMWNAGIRYSDAETFLVLNDDLVVNVATARETVTQLFDALTREGLVTVSHSFGHFGVTRACVKAIGWFDERFLGFGEEDGDFIWRYQSHFGKPQGNIDSFGLINESSRVGYDFVVSGPGKYSLFNREYLKVKYEFGRGDVAGPFGSVALKLLAEQDPFSTDKFRDQLIHAKSLKSQEQVHQAISDFFNKPIQSRES